jgi:hypothetical protein
LRPEFQVSIILSLRQLDEMIVHRAYVILEDPLN